MFPFGCILEQFRYFTKLGAKHAKLEQLMQKFVQRCVVRIFCNERSRSRPLDLELMFGAFLSVRVLFGPFHFCTKLGAKRAKLVQLMQLFMPRCRARIFRNERSRSRPLDPKLMFWCVFFLCGCIWNHFAIARNLLQNAPNWYN